MISVTVELPDDLANAIDRIRGEIPREVWIYRLVAIDASRRISTDMTMRMALEGTEDDDD